MNNCTGCGGVLKPIGAIFYVISTDQDFALCKKCISKLKYGSKSDRDEVSSMVELSLATHGKNLQ